ncbi:VWA domain-containing protein [Stygiolobus caldivivus]|uniref:VWFA domain-containing protein n=1 Tax=Stygiolobus caldivivus TaxID=2824673 RepID=A0A8D5U5V2_9CREN|nr:VWA domain-containing protein [Stygiolobus caldivivus]BCU69873.1 hypothetical protein KN1_11700 [Stygiolobus caldivivus]
MVISAKVEFSHRYSFTSPIRAVFRAIIVPEKLAKATGFHYIILLDNSLSMKGKKIDTAKNGVIELLNRIPDGNYVTLITFSDYVRVLGEFTDPRLLIPLVRDVSVEGGTSLYKALKKAINIAGKYDAPGYIILLTDGQPTDVPPLNSVANLTGRNYLIYYKMFRDKVLRYFDALTIPPGFKVISFGIGDDYIEEILKLLADKTGGVVNHINYPSEVVNVLPQFVVSNVGAKNVTVTIASESPVRLLNYPGPPVRLGAIEGVVKILGELTVPPQYNGIVMVVSVEYEDPVTGKKDSITREVAISPTNDQNTFLRGVNNDLLSEYQYYSLMQKLVSDLNTNDLTGATKALQQMQQIAQQTRKTNLIETTRKLQQTLGGNSDLNRASKEVTSEVTKKLRS